MKTHWTMTMTNGKLLIILLLISCVPSVGQISFTTQHYKLNTAFPGQCGLQAPGDFNNDGKPDLVVLNCGLGTISILINNGDGTLGPQRDFPALAPNPSGLTSLLTLMPADVNGDHNLDVIVSEQSADGSGTGMIGVLLGNGDGTFQPIISTNLGFFTSTFVGVGDFNSDGKLDLAVLGAPISEITLVPLLGNGDGTFTPGTALVPELGFDPSGRLVADLNGDGKLDILLSSVDSSNDMMLIPGKGDGTFQSPVTFASQAASTSTLTSGDFNHDDLADLVSTSYQARRCEFGVCQPVGPAGSLAVMLGNGDGTFGGPGIVTGALDFSNPSLGDFDGDGNLDIAVISSSQSGPSLYLGDGRGSFSAPTAISVTLDQPNEAVDLNRDGLDDLVAMEFSPTGAAEVVVQLNTTPNFYMNPTSTSQQVQAGGSATYTINIGQQNGFTTSVALSCASPVAQGIHCSISPASATPGSNVTLTVTTMAASAAASTRSGGLQALYALVLPLIALSGAVGRGKPKKQMMAVLLFCSLLFTGVSLQLACGGSGNGKVSNATPAGSYSVTVTATSGSLQRSITVTLKVL
jgi:FG-GAP-like repeat